MSAINGDKARFHRERKKKIHRRARKREMLLTLAKQLGVAPVIGGPIPEKA